jgi:hypothetical protein
MRRKKAAYMRGYYARRKDRIKTQRAEYSKKYSAAYREKNREALAEKARLWREANPEKMSAARRRWYENNKEKNHENNIRWRTTTGRLKHRAIRRNVQIRHRILIGGQALAKAYSKAILTIYRGCPKGHHVDHIIPLRGKDVCGLHVPWNLQYLPAQREHSEEQ